MKRQREEYEGHAPKERSKLKYSAEGFDDGILHELDGLLSTPETAIASAAERFLERGYGTRALQAWSYFVTTNKHSDIPRAQLKLAQLLELCNAHPSLATGGSALVKEIIEQHLKLVYRSLFANRPAPTKTALRLLTAVATFHRGAHALELSANMDFTLKVYPKLLQAPEGPADDESIRAAFIKFYLQFIRNGNSMVRKELITQRKIVGGWLKQIIDDSVDLIKEQLDTLRDCILLDPGILKTTKINFFNDWALGCIVRILPKSDEAGQHVADFLRTLATDPLHGIKFVDNAWYPRESDNGIFNKVLLSLLKLLKPWEQDLQQDLAIDILRESPELVAIYLKHLDDSFSMAPKLTAFWIGLMAFTTRVVSLPVPEFKQNHPPPLETVCENVFPSIFGKEALAKSIRHESKLIQMFALQVLIQSLKKLHVVQQRYRAKGWPGQELADELSWRYPQLATVITSVTFEGSLLRTAAFRALALYLETYPSSVGTTSLWDKIQGTEPGFQLLQLQDALSVQKLVSGTGKWWNKLPHSQYSLFTMLLRLRVLHDKYFMSQSEGILQDLVRPTLLFDPASSASHVFLLANSLEAFLNGKLLLFSFGEYVLF